MIAEQMLSCKTYQVREWYVPFDTFFDNGKQQVGNQGTHPYYLFLPDSIEIKLQLDAETYLALLIERDSFLGIDTLNNCHNRKDEYKYKPRNPWRRLPLQKA